MASDTWNSTAARLAVADMYSINLGANFEFVVGASTQVSLNLITRGHHPGIYLTDTTSPWRIGLEANVGWSLSEAWYTGSATQISIDSYLNSGKDISGSDEISADIFGSTDESGNFRWVGLAVGQPGLGLSYGPNDSTKLIASWQFQ